MKYPCLICGDVVCQRLDLICNECLDNDNPDWRFMEIVEQCMLPDVQLALQPIE